MHIPLQQKKTILLKKKYNQLKNINKITGTCRNAGNTNPLFLNSTNSRMRGKYSSNNVLRQFKNNQIFFYIFISYFSVNRYDKTIKTGFV